MAGPSSPHRADDRQESVGDLVALAATEIAQLVKCELDLAKMELKEDARKVLIGTGTLVVAVCTICLMVVLIFFAWAYGLAALGAPGGLWGAFLFAALTALVVVVALAGIGVLWFRGLNGLRRTRDTISRGLAMIRGRRGRKASGAPRAGSPRQAGNG